jgi:hypothetical protein
MPLFKASNLEGRDRLGHIEEFLSTNKSDWFVRQQLQMQAQGVTYQPYDRSCGGGQTAVTSQTIYYALVGVREGDVITNVIVDCTTAGSSISNTQSAVYLTNSQAGGTLVASSADSSGMFAAGGVKALSLTNSYTVPADGAVYLAFWSIAGSPVQLFRQNSSGVGCGQLTGAVARPYSAQAGQPTLPSSSNSSSGGGTYFWIGGS